jgi:hypothetical protein
VDIDGQTLEDVRIVSSGTGSAVLSEDGGHLSHDIVSSSADGAFACQVVSGSIADSVCLATGAEANALGTEIGAGSPETFTQSIRGVTAEAPNPSSTGLVIRANNAATIDVKATNDIIHGGSFDVVAKAEAPTATATVTLSHCDVNTHSTSGSTGTASVTGHATVTAAPRFVDPTNLNYRERPASPTIDKGTRDPAHDLDLVGRPRTIGSAPDIGAYEFLSLPTLSGLKAHAVTSTAAHLSVLVNAQGLKTRVRLIAKHGHSTVKSAWAAGHNKRVPLRLHLVITGLKSHTRYAIRAVANNPGGTKRSKPVSLTTH